MSTYVTTSRRSSGKPIHEHLSIPTAPFLVRNFEHSPRPFLPAFSSGLGRLLEAGELDGHVPSGQLPDLAPRCFRPNFPERALLWWRPPGRFARPLPPGELLLAPA